MSDSDNVRAQAKMKSQKKNEISKKMKSEKKNEISQKMKSKKFRTKSMSVLDNVRI